MLLSSSISLLKPDLIIPPSLILRGASSQIEFSSNLYKSSNVSNNSKSNDFNTLFILGNTLILFFNCITSLAFNVEHATLPHNLSKSYISYKYSHNSLLSKNSLINFSTKSCLLIISLFTTLGLII